MKVCVHIDRLVLDGLPVGLGQASAIEAGLVRELHALLKAGGLSPDLARGTALAALPAADFRRAGGEAPSQMGRQIAGALYAGLGARR